MSELKPCPFCGGEAILDETKAFSPMYTIVVKHTKNCFLRHMIATQQYTFKESAATAWNTRTPFDGDTTGGQAIIKGLREAIDHAKGAKPFDGDTLQDVGKPETEEADPVRSLRFLVDELRHELATARNEALEEFIIWLDEESQINVEDIPPRLRSDHLKRMLKADTQEGDG